MKLILQAAYMPLASLSFKALMDEGTKEFLKPFSLCLGTLKRLLEGRSW